MLAILIIFCYTLAYDYENVDGMRYALCDTLAYAVADKYGIPSLEQYAKSQFQENVKACSTEELAITIQSVYDTTPLENRGLRDIVVALCIDIYQKCIGSNDPSNAGFHNVKKKTG
jgi:hypothetical protein